VECYLGARAEWYVACVNWFRFHASCTWFDSLSNCVTKLSWMMTSGSSQIILIWIFLTVQIISSGTYNQMKYNVNVHWDRNCYFNLCVYGITLDPRRIILITAWWLLSENQAEICSCHTYDHNVICLKSSRVWRSLPPNRDTPFSASLTRSLHLFIHADLWWVCSHLVNLWLTFCPEFWRSFSSYQFAFQFRVCATYI
jgi:hypothetical protein